MTSITDKIQSLGQAVGSAFVKPDPARLVAYQNALNDSVTARDYLLVQRNLTDRTISHFQLGYDPVKNAIVIPVFKRGELINLRYRLIDPGEKSKYMQEKGCEVWLYNDDGLQVGMEKGGILITEGEFDLMSAWQAGFKNVISPASGKDSYGVWLEQIDNIKRVYIAYDNDKPGKEAAFKLASRIGIHKSFEVLMPHGIKDWNDYGKKFTGEDFKELLKAAKPYYKYQFKGLADIIESLRAKREVVLKIPHLPGVELGSDWQVVLSGDSGIGKTTVVMNIAREFAEQNVPVLVLPFERGSEEVGKRYLQQHHSLTKQELRELGDEEWEKIIKVQVDNPIYFAMPSREETIDLIIKAKRMFDTRVVIIDHLNYMIEARNSSEEMLLTKQFLQDAKRMQQDHGIILFLVHHIGKPDQAGRRQKNRRLVKEDLKGTSALYQVPEVVVMLSDPSENGDRTQMSIDIVKNKSPEEGAKNYRFNVETGRLGEEVVDPLAEQEKKNQKIWNSI